MDTTKAIGIIKEATASVQANLQVHQQIQEAIKVLEDAIKAKK